MTFEIYIISRFDESERPYVSTTCPTPERERELRDKGFQVHRTRCWIPSTSDGLPLGTLKDLPS